LHRHSTRRRRHSTTSERSSADIGRRFIERNGIAELTPGDAVRLFEAERQLELRRKAQILLDVWTPWLEGIAVYGELGADPALDPISINPVTDCLRNLLDFLRDSGSPVPPREHMEAHAQEFEQRCSEALKATGPTRLHCADAGRTNTKANLLSVVLL